MSCFSQEQVWERLPDISIGHDVMDTNLKYWVELDCRGVVVGFHAVNAQGELFYFHHYVNINKLL